MMRGRLRFAPHFYLEKYIMLDGMDSKGENDCT